jgi:hypothetical protein
MMVEAASPTKEELKYKKHKKSEKGGMSIGSKRKLSSTIA